MRIQCVRKRQILQDRCIAVDENGNVVDGDLIDMMFTVFGIRAGLKGRQEPEKRHFTCWLGIVLNGLVLLVLIMIFLGGLS